MFVRQKRNHDGNLLQDGLSRIESGQALSRVARPINETVNRVLRPGPLRDVLSGTAIGHPAHPALVSAPIGCWTGALVADVVGERRAARLLTAAGVFCAVPVASTGLSDWVDTTGAEQRVGIVHMGLNMSAVILYTASWWARCRQRHGLGIALGAGGAVLATAAGWLGGHLAYGLGVGVDTNSFEGGPTEWTALTEDGSVDDGSDEERLSSGEVGGVGVVVARPEGSAVDTGRADVVADRPHVLANRCSHRGGPLAEGKLIGGCIRCPWHSSEFDLATGAVRRGPATVPQPVYQVRGAGEGRLECRRDEPRSLRLNSAGP